MAKDWQRKLKRELKTEALKEFEGWVTNDFVTHIMELRERLEALEKVSRAIKPISTGDNKKQVLNERMFKQEWSYPHKIHFLLELHQKPLTSEDLDRYLSKLDKHYKDYNNPKNNLSVHLSRATKSGRIKKIKEPGIKLKYFVLPEWMKENGDIDAGYRKHMKSFI